jgi:ABC-2 type transport system permease protein
MRALAKLTLVEMKLFMREPVTLVFTLILPLIILVVMGEVFGKAPGTGEAFRGVNAMDYYTPVYLGVVMAAVGVIAIPVHIAGYRERGILRRLQASSLSISRLFLAQLIVGLIITIVSVCILLVPAILVYHIKMPHSPGLILLGALLSMVAFVMLGVFLGFILPTARAAQGVGMPLWFIMFIISGAGPPRAVMSPIMQDVGQVLPLWHTTSLIQDIWLGSGWNLVASGVMVGVLVAAAAISFLIFRRE